MQKSKKTKNKKVVPVNPIGVNITNMDCAEVLKLHPEIASFGLIISDPFFTIDTVEYAMKNHKLNLIGFDLDKNYLERASKKIKKIISKK